MSRALDFTVWTVIVIIAVAIHLIAVELFAPGTPLYDVATSGTEAMNGQARVTFWYKVLTVWMPLMAAGGITAWVFVREYRRQAISTVRRVG